MSIQTSSEKPSSTNIVGASSPAEGQAPKVYFPPVKQHLKDRSGCLWVWLTVLTIITLASVATNTINIFTASNALNAPEPTELAVFAGLALLQLLALVGIWSWRQWGIYGYALASVLNFVALIAFQRANYGDIPVLVLSLGLLFMVTGEDQHNFD